MRKIFISGAAIALFLAFSGSISAQMQKKAVLTADSLATGNYKDVLTSFFQLSFDKLTGKDKELKFSSNPYAVMMRANPDLELDYNYKRNKFLRNLNFNFSIKLDTSYRFNGFSSGVSYALINKRDYTVFDEFLKIVTDSMYEYNKFTDGLSPLVQGITDVSLKNKVREQGHKLFTDTTFTFDKVDNEVKKYLLKLIKDSNLVRLEKMIKSNDKANVAKNIKNAYNEEKSFFQTRPLLTLSISDTTYKDDFMFSNINLKLEYLKGLGKSKAGANWEFNIPAQVNFLDDTMQKKRDLKRAVFRVEPGINLVLRNKSAQHSMFEFKFSGEYYHFFSGLYPGEEKDRFTFNGTIRVRVINDIWIPLQFKYDPDKGNVFGFLSVKFNFAGQGKK